MGWAVLRVLRVVWAGQCCEWCGLGSVESVAGSAESVAGSVESVTGSVESVSGWAVLETVFRGLESCPTGTLIRAA